ncbi:MAG: hypothetical protein EA373_07520 [Oceanospirillales bacterium]|nr:MAG: hypothetical protein EA373_07520 [Oceanospirillales bacterium]
MDLVWPVQANELFVMLPKPLAETLQAQGAVFYEWDVTTLPEGYPIQESHQFVRMVTSFATTDMEVEQFLALCVSVKR